jgi:hypothetical protein
VLYTKEYRSYTQGSIAKERRKVWLQENTKGFDRSYVAPEAKPNQDDLCSQARSQVHILSATHHKKSGL